MEEAQLKRRKALATKLIWISVVSLGVGGLWAWLIAKDGGPEALGAIIPLLLVGGVHLITGPIAIFQAFKMGQFNRYRFVYGYFSLFLIATVWLFPPDIFTYVILFLFLTLVPIAFTSVVGIWKNRR